MTDRRDMLRPGVIALAAVAVCVLGCLPWAQTPRSLGSYLFAWLFLLGLSLGSLAALMMHHLTGGAWSAPVHRYFHCALAPLPLLALLFLPIALGAFHSFPWSAGMAAAGAERFRAHYLAPWPFLARAVVALGAWCVLAGLLRGPTRAHNTLSALGLLVYPLTMSWAAVDWIGSLEPRWSSTVLGLLVMLGQGVGAFAFAIVCATRRAARGATLTAERCGDLGNLLLTFVMTWMYLAFVQFLITWAEDLPRETLWYLPRLMSSWRGVTLALVIAQFAVPFALLLLRPLKRDPASLGRIALLVLVANWVYVGWLVLPSLTAAGLSLTWSDLVDSLVLGALWLAVFRLDLARPVPGSQAAPGEASRLNAAGSPHGS